VLLLIITVVYSCGDDKEETNLNPISYYDFPDSLLVPYLGQNYKSDFELYSYANFNGDYKDDANTPKVAIVGVKDGHLWLGIFNVDDERKVFEWTDANTFEYNRTIDEGYGKYKEVEISSICNNVIIQTAKGFLLSIQYNIGDEKNYFSESYSLYGSKLEKLDYSIQERWFGDYILCKRGDWYNDIIVSPDGDILEEFTTLAIKMLSDTELLSYCEGIEQSHLMFSRIKYEKTNWKVEYKPSFNVESDTKIESSIVEKNADYWVYQIVFTYYSGEKKTVNLVLSLKDGAISERE